MVSIKLETDTIPVLSKITSRNLHDSGLSNCALKFKGNIYRTCKDNPQDVGTVKYMQMAVNVARDCSKKHPVNAWSQSSSASRGHLTCAKSSLKMPRLRRTHCLGFMYAVSLITFNTSVISLMGTIYDNTTIIIIIDRILYATVSTQSIKNS